MTDVHKIKHFVIGESLPPECKPILEQLGLWNDFKGDGHRPCYGIYRFGGMHLYNLLILLILLGVMDGI